MLPKYVLKSACSVDVEPSCNLYCLFKFVCTCVGKAPLVNVTVLPDDVPVNVAVKVVAFDGLPIVVGSTSLSSKLATNDSVTISFLVTQGSTAYYMTALTIEGNAQTVKYSGGTAPAAGNASSVDIYSFTIIKTAATPTYTVFGAGPVKYA